MDHLLDKPQFQPWQLRRRFLLVRLFLFWLVIVTQILVNPETRHLPGCCHRGWLGKNGLSDHHPGTGLCRHPIVLDEQQIVRWWIQHWWHRCRCCCWRCRIDCHHWRYLVFLEEAEATHRGSPTCAKHKCFCHRRCRPQRLRCPPRPQHGAASRQHWQRFRRQPGLLPPHPARGQPR